MSYKDNFIDYGFDEFILGFKNFRETKEYTTCYQELISNLDEDSINNIDNFLNLMYKLPLPSKDYLVRKTSIYNQKELQQIIEEDKFINLDLPKIKETYKLQGFEKLEVNVFKHHCGLKFIPKERLKSLYNTVFIDAGAFWGDSALILNKYKPKHIVCFEPNTVNYSLLKTTIKNNIQNTKTTINKCGLYKKESYEELHYISNIQNHGASMIYKPKKNKTEQIKLISLDEYINKYLINEIIGLIKIDVEGVGLEAIEGAKHTIEKHKPIISCAVYHNPKELFYIKNILQKINPNYKFLFKPLLQSFTLKELTLIAF